MATETDLADNVFFIGDDWPAIQFQLAPTVNISGWSLSWTLYASPNVKVMNKPLTITSGSGGTAQLPSVAASETANLAGVFGRAREYRWVVIGVDVSNKEHTLGYGTMLLRAP